MTTTPTREAPPSRRRHPRLSRPERASRLPPSVALGVTLTGCASGATGRDRRRRAPAPPQHQPADTPSRRTTSTRGSTVPSGRRCRPRASRGRTVSVVADGELADRARLRHGRHRHGRHACRGRRPDRTLFRVGSVSKVVSATAIMQLVEDGDLDLDATCSNTSTSTSTPRRHRHPAAPAHPHRRLRRSHLGAHRTPGTEKTLREAVSDAPPAQVFTPGTTPAYSNYGATWPFTSPSGSAACPSTSCCSGRSSTGSA